MSKPVGIALIGMGWWGKKMLSVLQAAPQDIRVVRAVEPNVETVRTICAEKGIALSANYSDALSDPAVEAVVLATPHSLHGAQIEAAVAAGKHVFCEKPLALTKAGAEKAVALCRDAGLVLGMGHERRWEPPIAEMLAMADAGKLGLIHQIESNFSHDKFLTLDRDNWRLKADQAPAGDPVEAVQELTKGGADLVIEAAGHASSLANVFDYDRLEGRISMVGINIGQKISVELGKIQIMNLTVRGCIGSSGVWPAAIRFRERTGIDLSPIQTHTFALDDALEALELGKNAQKAVKVTLEIA